MRQLAERLNPLPKVATQEIYQGGLSNYPLPFASFLIFFIKLSLMNNKTAWHEEKPKERTGKTEINGMEWINKAASSMYFR